MRLCCDCVRACVKYTYFTLKEEGKKSVAGRKTVWKILHKLFVLDFRRDLDGDPEADSSEGGREPESGFAHGRREKSRCCDLKYDKKKSGLNR